MCAGTPPAACLPRGRMGYRGTKCAKRTQFRRVARASLRLRSQGRLCPWVRIMGARAHATVLAAGIPHHSTILSFHHPHPISIVQNEPNLACHCGLGGRRVQNEPNWPGPNAQNEPNFSRRAGRAPAGANRAKQSQLAPGRCRARTPNPRSGRGRAPRRAGTNCAKRSQFPGGVRWDGAWGRRTWGEMRKTNPISADQDIPPFHYSTLPIRGCGGLFACPGGRRPT